MGKQLLTIGNDAKTVKGQKYGYLTGVLYLAPVDTAIAGKNICPFASDGCAAACLYTAGRGRMNGTQAGRVRRTMLWHDNPEAFVAQLQWSIDALVRKAKREDFTPVVRLNGTSDIQWEKTGIIAANPDVQFYDYTKWPSKYREQADNYHLTYSLSEDPKSMPRAKAWLKQGGNVAVVFRTPEMVAHVLEHGWMGYPAVDGDEHDARFIGESGVIVALKAKGDGKKDTSGFVQDVAI